MEVKNMRGELENKILMALTPYRNKIPFEELKAEITIALNAYEVTNRSTEIAIRDEDKNKNYLALFIASKAAGGRTERTLQFYKNSLSYIFARIGKSIDQITSDDIKMYLAIRINRDHISKTTANNDRRNLSSFFEWMVRNEYLLKNPMNKVEMIKEKKVKKKAFSEIEVEKIRDACTTSREKALVEILFSSWGRVSEISQIRIDEIENGKVTLHGKGEKDRTAFLNAKAQLAIEQYMNEREDHNPFLFPKMMFAGSIPVLQQKIRKKADLKEWYKCSDCVDPYDHTDKGTVESIIRKIGKQAGVENTHPHRFRRTGATFALKSGMDITTVSKILGHANLSVTQVYLDITDEDLENDYKKYAR